MNIKNKNTLLGISMGLGLTLLSAQAHALSLPMYNYPLPAGVDTKGYQVFTGVNVDVDMKNIALAVKPSGDIYYVPEIATVEMSGRTISIGANCSAVDSELESERVLASTRLNLIKQLESSQTLIVALLADSNKQTGLCIENTALSASYTEIVNGFTGKLITARGDFQSAKSAFERCKLVSGEPACNAEKNQMVTALDALDKVYADLTTADGKLNGALTQKARACAQADAAGARLANVTSTINSILGQVAEIQSKVSGTIDLFGTQLGGVASANISSRSVKQQEELQKANPQVRVRPIEIDRATFNIVPSAADQDGSIERRYVLGVGVTGADPVPELTGQTALKVVNAPGSVGVLLTLSRLGACSQAQEFQAGFNYAYRTYSYLQGKAYWNKWATFEKIESTSSKQRFFSSKTVHKLWSDMKAGDGFRFVLANEDSGVNANQMREELQSALLDRIIGDWAIVQGMDSNGNMAMPKAGAHGAQVAAEGLSKCPHVYCQAGSFALKTLDAAFGSDTSTEEIKKAWNVEDYDEFSYTQVFTKYASTSTRVVIQ